MKKYQLGGEPLAPVKQEKTDNIGKLLSNKDFQTKSLIERGTAVPGQKTDFKSIFDNLQSAILGIGAVADMVNEANNRDKEDAKMIEALQPLTENNFIQNDIPVYTKEGGRGKKYLPKAEEGIQYRPSTATERSNWNKFLGYLKSKNMLGSKDLDSKDKSLGLSLLKEYNKQFPDSAVSEDFIPIAQQESIYLKEGTLPEVGKLDIFLPDAFKNRQTSQVDNWLGSLTSSNTSYPVFQKSDSEGNKYNFGTDYKGYADFMKDPSTAKKYIAKMEEGGSLKEVKGLPKGMEHMADVEAEAGEVYQTPEKDVYKIDENGNRHEDGGEYIENVEKVLEDTSTHRKDKNSKSLVVTPEIMQELFGIKTKKNLSHAEAFEHVEDFYEKDKKKIGKKLEEAMAKLKLTPSDVYAKNSMELNSKSMEQIPSENDIFELLFAHQEAVKTNRDMKKAKYGINIPKAQDGYDKLFALADKVKSGKASKADIKAFQQAFHANPTTYAVAEKILTERTPVTNLGKSKGYVKGDVRQNEDGLLGDSTKQYLNFIDELKSRQPKPQDSYEYTPTELDYTDNSPVDGIGRMLSSKEFQNIALGAVENVVNNPSTDDTTDSNQQNNIKINEGLGDRFNMPLTFNDVAAPIYSFLSADRIPARYNPAEFTKIAPRLEDVRPFLESAQRDFNALTSTFGNSGAGMANATDLFSKKYSVDNQVRASVNDRNIQRQSAADMYNAQVSDKQSVANQQARAMFEQQQLAGMEAQRKQKLQALDELFQRINLNRKQNTEGELIMQLFPNFNQQGRYIPGTQRNLASGVSSTPNNRNLQTFQVTLDNGQVINLVRDEKGKLVSSSKDMTNRRQNIQIIPRGGR